MIDDTELPVAFFKGGAFDNRKFNQSGVAALPALTRSSTIENTMYRFSIEE